MTTTPLMPKATAVWLIENTALSFEQISDFCNLHMLEIQALADAEDATTIVGFDPIASAQLTLEEIKRCEADPDSRLVMREVMSADQLLGKKRTKYTPLSKRQDRPDAIAWFVKFYPDIPDSEIIRLLGTTKTTIQAVRTKTHRNAISIKPRSPVLLGLCHSHELDQLIERFGRKDAS